MTPTVVPAIGSDSDEGTSFGDNLLLLWVQFDIFCDRVDEFLLIVLCLSEDQQQNEECEIPQCYR